MSDNALLLSIAGKSWYLLASGANVQSFHRIAIGLSGISSGLVTTSNLLIFHTLYDQLFNWLSLLSSHFFSYHSQFSVNAGIASSHHIFEYQSNTHSTYSSFSLVYHLGGMFNISSRVFISHLVNFIYTSHHHLSLFAILA